MKIGLLYNQNQANAWYEADFDTSDTIVTLKDSLDEIDARGNTSLMRVTRENYPEILTQLIAKKVDIIFNVTEGYPGESRESVWPVMMEQFQIQYTGPRPKNLTITLDKSITKKLLSDQLSEYLIQEELVRTDTPITIDTIESIGQQMRFPLFVKFNSEGSSLGINKDSIIINKNSLYSKLLGLREVYPFADILVEEYIEGTDVSTTFIDGLGVFGPVEYQYNNQSKVYDYNMKIFDYDSTVNVKTHDSENAEKIIAVSKEIVQILGLEGYARLEFRVTNNKIKFVEVNNQVCFMPGNAFMRAATEDTMLSFSDIVVHIVNHRLRHPITYPLITP